MNRKMLVAVALGQLSFGIAVAAVAGDKDIADNQVVVSYKDLNVQTTDGQRTLKYRIAKAAQGVCPDRYSRDLGTRVAGKSCVRQAVSQGMNDVSQQQLARAAALEADRG